MPMPERYHPECPPNAHKVIRPPENESHALLCVAVADDELKNGVLEVAQLISLMDKKPRIVCSDQVYEQILSKAAEAEIEPSRIEIHDNGTTASVRYQDGSISETFAWYGWAGDASKFEAYLEKMPEKCLISVDMPSMYTLRSIATVFPWDALLAKQFLSQYLKASAALTDEDRSLLKDIRYGRVEANSAKEKSETAYQFLRLERKLFLQYPTDQD